MENLVGKKMYGFKFKGSLHYSINMNKHIGKIGTIIAQDYHDYYYTNTHSCRVQFKDGEIWSYPYPEVLDHLVDDTKTIEELLTEMKQLISRI